MGLTGIDGELIGNVSMSGDEDLSRKNTSSSNKWRNKLRSCCLIEYSRF